jgi:hypothetical protein
MVRIANLLGGIGKSAVRLGPLDAVFAVGDYAQGKAEGEDDIRAATGAAGSAAGGWGGALAGAAVGQALIPIPLVGAGIGAIAGGIGGSFLGGYGADRVDQIARGNQGANREEQTPEDYTARNAVGGAAALGAGAYGLKKLGDNDMMGGYNPAKARGYEMGQQVRQGFGTAVDAAGNVLRRVPIKQIGAAGLALGAGALANEAMGNPLGGAIDAVTMGATNLRPDMDTSSSLSGRDPSIPDPYERQVRQSGFANQRDFLDYQNQLGQQNAQIAYDRKFDYDDYMGRMKINADQASELLRSYDAGMQNATQAAQVVLGTKWI